MRIPSLKCRPSMCVLASRSSAKRVIGHTGQSNSNACAAWGAGKRSARGRREEEQEQQQEQGEEEPSNGGRRTAGARKAGRAGGALITKLAWRGALGARLLRAAPVRVPYAKLYFSSRTLIVRRSMMVGQACAVQVHWAMQLPVQAVPGCFDPRICCIMFTHA